MKSAFIFMLIVSIPSLWAQTLRFNVSPNPNNTFFKSNGGDHIGHCQAKNLSGSNIQVSWIREIKQKPDGWVCFVCDANYCYGDHLNASPYVNAIRPDQSVNLDVHIMDNDVIGNAHVILWVFEKEDSSKKIRTDYYFNKIIENGNYQNSDFKIMHHPLSNVINVSYIQELRRIDVYSILGNKVITFNPSTDGNYDLSSLNDGMYCVSIIGANDRLLGSKKIIKSSLGN